MGSTRAAGAFLTTTLGLGPALQAAFPVIGAIALIDILAQIPKAIGKMEDALAGWGAEEKRIFSESVHEAAGLISVYDSLARREAERAGAGQAGSGKYGAQINALARSGEDCKRAEDGRGSHQGSQRSRKDERGHEDGWRRTLGSLSNSLPKFQILAWIIYRTQSMSN